MKDTKTLNTNVLAEEYEEITSDSAKFHKPDNITNHPSSDAVEELTDFLLNEVSKLNRVISTIFGNSCKNSQINGQLN